MLELWPLDTITPGFWINTHSVTSPVDEAVHGLNRMTVKLKHQSCVHFYQHVCTLHRKGIKDSTPHPTHNSNILYPTFKSPVTSVSIRQSSSQSPVTSVFLYQSSSQSPVTSVFVYQSSSLSPVTSKAYLLTKAPVKVQSHVKRICSPKLTRTTTGFFCRPLSCSSCCTRPSFLPAHPSCLWLCLCRMRVEREGNAAAHRLQVKEASLLGVALALGCCRWNPTGVNSASLSCSLEASGVSSVSEDRLLSFSKANISGCSIHYVCHHQHIKLLQHTMNSM